MFEIENKEFEKEEYFDYFERPIDQINYMLLKKPILYSQLKEIKETERNKYFWIKKAQSLEVTKKIQKELVKSIRNGESFYYFKERLKKQELYSPKDRAYWESAYNQNVTIAQSMSNFKEMQSMKNNGFKYARYSAILDGRTTEICHNLHGKVMKIDEWEAQGLIPPVHYGCRSTLVQLSDREVEGENGELRKHIKTIEPEKLPKLKKLRQVSFGIGDSYMKMLAEYVEKKQKKVYNLTKEILLNPNDIPKTLSNFKDYSKQWENGYIKPILNDSQRQEITDNLNKIIEDNELSMRFNPNNFEKLMIDGRFKNQFETGTSGGTLANNLRKKGSKKLFGHSKRLKPYEYEKYGYLGHRNYLDDYIKSDTEQYGSAIIRFDKEKLMGKVTFTINDSLGLALAERIIASDVYNPNVNSMNIYNIKNIYNHMKNKNGLTLDDFTDNIIGNERIRYFELQFHGNLNLDHVKEICFNLEIPKQEILDKLKKMGIKLWKVEGGKLIEIN